MQLNLIIMSFQNFFFSLILKFNFADTNILSVNGVSIEQVGPTFITVNWNVSSIVITINNFVVSGKIKLFSKLHIKIQPQEYHAYCCNDSTLCLQSLH